jgi:uncharacterized protein (DUF58 family)
VTGWGPTGGLSRGATVAGLGLALAALFGDPVLVVLVSPIALVTLMGLLFRPRVQPSAHSRLGHVTLHEGQGTTSILDLTGTDDAEYVTRVGGQAAYVALHPSSGAVGAVLEPGAEVPTVAVSPRRWGRVVLPPERVGLTTPWGGYRWGPEVVTGQQLTVLPTTAPFDSRAEVPQPLGLVGAYRSRRRGGGSEFAGIRPFLAGDRLRRVNWRVSLRTGELHVQDTQAEEDAGVLIVVDSLAEHGRSGGVDGRASSLDLTVRAAAALAEHYVRSGDRVGLRIVGGGGELVGLGSGQRHLRVLWGTLARVYPATPRDLTGDALPLRATAGMVVVFLSPMLHPAVVSAAATLTRRGLPVLVVDTLPEGLVGAASEGVDPDVASMAWRLRHLERDQLLDRLAATGCPVVPWRGPGTLDDVLRRLARRARLPQVGHR